MRLKSYEITKMMKLNKLSKTAMQVYRSIYGVAWHLLLLFIPTLFFLLFLSFSSKTFRSFSPHRTFTYNRTLVSTFGFANTTVSPPPYAEDDSESRRRLGDLVNRSRIAVCLVGGARRFELTGPSIVENVLEVYPNADLFLHSPIDDNAFKLSLLKVAPRIAWVRIFEPETVTETDHDRRVLTANNSPNGLQGLLRYFSLVEGCLTMINEYQTKKNFKYDWIIRTRVDGYWNAPLDPRNFIPGHYLVPQGSSYGGLNDRFGIGDLNTSTIALSRRSLIPKLDSAELTQLNSESAFKAQLTTQHVPYLTKRLPFCIVTDRRYDFPPSRYGVPVTAMSSPGPLSGTKCRPCTPACKGRCVADVMNLLLRGWSWTDWGNGSVELCNAGGGWEKEWETIFDENSGKNFADARKRTLDLTFKECVDDFNEMKERAFRFESISVEEICKLGTKKRN